MTFDPISYSLAKKKSEAVINSTSPPEIDKFWYDANRGVLRGYSFKNGEWRFLSKYGYDDFDNPGYGGWGLNIQIPISTSPSESIQYCIEINGDNIYVKSNDLTKNLATGTGGTTFWQNVSGVNDIRVFDENFIQNYFWIEEFNTVNQVAKIWVKLNAGQTMVGIAFGNPYAGVSSYHNGDMTFEFFDDFVDLSNWTVLNGGGTGTASTTIYNGKTVVKLSPEGSSNRVAIVSPYNSNENDIFEICFFTDVDVIDGILMAYDDGSMVSSSNDFSNNGYMLLIARDNVTDHNITKAVSGGATELVSVPGTVSSNVTYVSSFIWKSNNLIGILNGNKILSTTDSTFTSFNHVHISCADNYWYVDWARVRKTLSSDLSFGTPKVDTF